MKCFLLLRPRILAIKNSLLLNRKSSRRSQRELIFTIISCVLFIFVYKASISTFTSVKSHAPAFDLPPDIVIALFFSLLSGMIFLSGAAASLGAFYLGSDLDFLFSKPVSSFQFLLGKGLETIVQSSWMVLVFGIPTLIALGVVYEMPLLYHFLSITAILPVLAIPTLLGIITISSIIRIVPPRKTKEFLFIAASALILYIYLTAKNFLVTPPMGATHELTQSMRQLIQFSSSSFLPSTWAASLLGDFIRNPVLQETTCYHLVMLYGITLFLAVLALIILQKVHFDAFTQARSTILSTKVYNQSRSLKLQKALSFIPAPLRSLWAKEMKLFGRDLTQGLQLVMLLGICLIYLYNFRIIHHVTNLKPETMLWWKGTLFLCNIGMGAFIITAVSSRFVFPSLSLEGQTFWIIRAAPLSLHTVLRAKFWIWYLPIGVISDIVLVSGALAIDAEPSVILATAIFSWFLCLGLVGLGIGLGSLFANFDWDSAPQVSASFGNFIYMITGTLLIALNLIPILLITILGIVKQSGVQFSETYWYFALCSASILVFYINYATYRYSLSLGENALLKKT